MMRLRLIYDVDVYDVQVEVSVDVKVDIDDVISIETLNSSN